MKISVEIDLPWIDHNGHLNEEMELNVIDSLTRRINSQMMVDLKPKMDALMNKSVENAIDNILNDYLSKPVVISNGFKKEEYESGYDMVEKKFGALYDAEIKRTSNSCGTDPILAKLDTKMKQAMQQLFMQIETKIDKEAKLISAQTLKESSLYAAMQKVGIKD